MHFSLFVFVCICGNSIDVSSASYWWPSHPFSVMLQSWRSLHFRNNPPEVLLWKGFLKICSKFTGEHRCRSLISMKFLCNFIEIALRHGCSLISLLHIFRATSSKIRTQDPRTRDTGPGSLDQRALGHKTQDPRPGNHDARTDTQDTGPRTREPRTKDPGPRNPKFGTLGLWTFLLSFKIKHWNVRNHLQVNLIMQSTLSHIFTSTYFSRVRVCFWNFQEDSGYCWFLFKWFF